jgi:hypothetical protein
VADGCVGSVRLPPPPHCIDVVLILILILRYMMGSTSVSTMNLTNIQGYLTVPPKLLASSRQTFAFSRDGGKAILLK